MKKTNKKTYSSHRVAKWAKRVGDNLVLDAVDQFAYEAYREGRERYELPASETKSGLPEVFDFRK